MHALACKTTERRAEAAWLPQVKLVLALTWQVAGHQRRDGGPTGYPQVMENMR
jgi:hypothetical protein